MDDLDLEAEHSVSSRCYLYIIMMLMASVLAGLDHGVFVPFSLMFPNKGKDTTFDIPVVQASIDGRLNSHTNEALGRAVSDLRKEGILILSGGLTYVMFNWISRPFAHQ